MEGALPTLAHPFVILLLARVCTWSERPGIDGRHFVKKRMMTSERLCFSASQLFQKDAPARLQDWSGGPDVSSSPPGLSIPLPGYRRVIGKCGNHLRWVEGGRIMEVEVDGRWTEESWKVESGSWKVEGRIMESEWRTINTSIRQTSCTANFPLDPLLSN